MATTTTRLSQVG
jgi:hypothetical protein